MQDQKRLGENLKKLRHARGWSQEDFAHHSGIYRTDVGAYENGKRNLTLRTMRTLADTYGVKIADLLKGV
jgi:transcriptional regulator with XRE-family HTH domain